MALKSSREGLRKELVDYLGNIIVDDNLRNEIVKAVGDKFVTPEVLNENVNNLTMQITTESGERIEADNTLQNNITVEATAREDADTTLQNNINAETTAREEAISNLEELIGTGGKFYGIDTSNIIASGSGSGSNTLNYTATQDCWIYVHNIAYGCDLNINGVNVIQFTTGSDTTFKFYAPLKKGQIATTGYGNALEGNAGYVVYGIKG